MRSPAEVAKWVKTNDYFSGGRVEQSKDVYVPSNVKYPHIHIGEDHITYSKGPSNHALLIKGDVAAKDKITEVRDSEQEAHIVQICRFLLNDL